DLPRRAGQSADHTRRGAPPVRRDDPCPARAAPGHRTGLGDVRILAGWHDRPRQLDHPELPTRLGGSRGQALRVHPAAGWADRRHPDPSARSSLCPNRLPLAAGECPGRTQRGSRRHGRRLGDRRDDGDPCHRVRGRRHLDPYPRGTRPVKRVLNIVPVPVPPEALDAFAAQLSGDYVHPAFENVFVSARNGGGPPDSAHETTLADAFVLDAGCRAEEQGYVGVCVNSMSDSALAALRSRLSIPVVAPSQATMLLACMLGKKFSVITMWPQWHELYHKAAREN